jgi:chaperonin cofactor prefoldin
VASLSPYLFAALTLQELDALKETDAVYKMHGKVLIRQDTSEAKGTVNSRLKLIQTEM